METIGKLLNPLSWQVERQQLLDMAEEAKLEVASCRHAFPKGPCTQTVYSLGPKYPK